MKYKTLEIILNEYDNIYKKLDESLLFAATPPTIISSFLFVNDSARSVASAIKSCNLLGSTSISPNN